MSAALKTEPVTLTYYVAIGTNEDGEVDDKVKVTIKTFSSGDTVEWLKWLKSFERLIRLKSWTDGPTLFLNARIVLRDMALDAFNAAAALADTETPQTFNKVMMEVARVFIVRDAREYLLDIIKSYRKPRDVSVATHLAEFRQLATLITILPEDDAPLSEKALMYHFKKGMPIEWQQKYDESGKEAPTLTEMSRYFTRLEMNQSRKEATQPRPSTQPRPGAQPRNQAGHGNSGQNSHGNSNNNGGGGRNNSNYNRGNKKPGKPNIKASTGKWCDHHRTNTHSNEECNFQKRRRNEAEFNYVDLPDEELNAIENEQPAVATALRTETLVRLSSQHQSSPLVRALIDTGASKTLVDASLLEQDVLTALEGCVTRFRLPQGRMTALGQTLLVLQLPEFNEHRRVTWSCAVAEQLPYKLIIGRDMLQSLGFVLDFAQGTITWDGVTVQMHKNGSSTAHTPVGLPVIATASIDAAEQRQFEIIAADYKKEPLEDCIPDRLSSTEQKDLLTFLKSFEDTLFSGKLGFWKGEPYDIPTIEPLEPFHAKPYPIPHSLLEPIKKEIRRLEAIGAICRDTSSPWASPAFVIPKKDLSPRLLCDLRRLNKQIRRHPWPLPKIIEIFRHLPRFVLVTVIDLNMGYYAIHLTYRSSLLTAFILPFGKYRWLRLPMGISTAPDHIQARIDQLLGDLKFVRCYLDDVMIITETNFADHLRHLKIVFTRLRDAGLTINVKKCKFAVTEANYLGYKITTEGIMPQPEKIAAIQRIRAPGNKRELRHFIGLVNYYRDVWPQRAHLLAPLTQLTSRAVPWVWEERHQDAFDKLKALAQRETLLHFPDYSRGFDIHTDASSVQLGGVISQCGQPLAFYSRKLTPAQRNYSVMEQELLSIVEILKEFRSLLFGQLITVYTDHKNLSCANFSSSRVMRWRLIIEEFGPTIKYIKGADNVAADALSRLPRDEDFDEDAIGSLVEEDDAFPLTYERLAAAQQADEELAVARERYPQKFKTKTFGKHEIITSVSGLLVIPPNLQIRVLDYFHSSLLHPGMKRMYKTMGASMFWPGMKRSVEDYVRSCVQCQTWKRSTVRYGKLPEKQHPQVKWADIAVDEIGPYSYSDSAKAPKLYALTIIELTTNWIEIVPLKNKQAKTAALALDEYWFCRYPRPERCIHDQGKEFAGREFQELLESYGVKSKPITIENPQANSVLERVHQVIGNMVRTTRLDKQKWTEILPGVAFALRATYHTVLRASPAQLVFGRDMMMSTEFNANWAAIYSHRQKETRRNTDRENAGRKGHSYNIGDRVLLLKDLRNLAKLAQPTSGPYSVTAVHDNGTVTINRGSYVETVNVRRIKPFFTPTTPPIAP